MEMVVFTKHFTGRNLRELSDDVRSSGAAGADLCVRQGYPVEPDNILEKLPRAVKEFKYKNLVIPMVTTPVDFVEPEKAVTEKVFSACQNTGVKLVKLGYWHMGKGGYWKTVATIKDSLEKFVRLAEKYQIKVLIHNHSGATMGLNSSSVMHILNGFDPEYVGVFADPGHLSLTGEPLDMALDIVKKYLSAVAVKDVIREKKLVDGKRIWQLKVVPLGKGYVDWNAMVKILLEYRFKGPVSIHSEYSGLPLRDLIKQTRIDIEFLTKTIIAMESENKGSV